MANRWSENETNQLRINFNNMSIPELAKLLNRTCTSVRSKACDLQLRKPKGVRIKRQRVDSWKVNELMLLEHYYPVSTKEELQEFFPERSYGAIKTKARELGLLKTTETRRRIEQVSPRNAFPKGNVPTNYLPIGTIAVRTQNRNRRPYYWIKVNEGRVKKDRWRCLHVVLWEQENGPTPAGHIIRFIDGNTLNVQMDNLELITRHQHAEETRQSDQYIAATISKKKGTRGVNRELYNLILENPALIELKRKQILLNKKIKENEQNKSN